MTPHQRVHAAVRDLLDAIGLDHAEVSRVTVEAGCPLLVDVVRVETDDHGVRRGVEVSFTVEADQ